MSETVGVAENTDRELWREPHPEGDAYSYYSPSVHVTAGGGIGINVGGMVFVKPLREWHRLATEAEPVAQAREWDDGGKVWRIPQSPPI